MDYRKLNDQITEVVAQGLHYAENIERINTMKTATEVSSEINGGMDRYMKDHIYHAKVQSLVAILMQVVRQNIEETNQNLTRRVNDEYRTICGQSF